MVEIALPTSEEYLQRKAFREQLYQKGKKVIADRKKMPLQSGSEESGEWIYQEVQEVGIMTCCQKQVVGITPKKLMTFGYDVATHMPVIAEGKAEMRLISEVDGCVVTHHQRMITPFIISNRSVFPSTYHQHSDGLDSEYTLIRSSMGNDAVADAEAEAIGNDVEADMILFWVNAIPTDANSSQVQFCINLNLGGGLPQRMREMIAGKQVGFLDMLQKYFTNSAQAMEDSFKRNEAKILANIQLQKDEIAQEKRIEEEKKARKEAKKKAKAEKLRKEAEEKARLKALELEAIKAADVEVATAQKEPVASENVESDADFQVQNLAGGLTERENANPPDSARKLLSTEEADPQKNEQIAGEQKTGEKRQPSEVIEVDSNDMSDSSDEEEGKKKAVKMEEDPETVIKECIAKSEMPIKITWDDLKFTVAQKSKDDLKILKGCSGSAMPGQATYIMGSSGAGKTSLLNMISDRMSSKRGSKLEGSVTVNDKTKLDQHVFGQIGAYVMQDDILFSYFTVEEAFNFAARLKLDIPVVQQNRRVKKLMQELGLWDIRTTIVGDSMRKTISGGERKRTAIGVEMITDPQVLLLDEPTSGLDSFRAYSIVRFLRAQARKGKTVIATIHQPSSEAYISFDKVVLMCDGHIVYQGRPSGVPAHFAKLDIPFPQFANPADVAMKILSINYPKKPEDEKYIMSLKDLYDTTQKTEDKAFSDTIKLSDVKIKKRPQANCCLQFRMLCRRNKASIKRNPLVLKARVGQSVVLGLLAAAVFEGSNGPLPKNQQNLAGAMFFMATATFMPPYMMTGLTFQVERPVFLREQANKMYGVVPYFFAKILSDVPSFIIAPTLFTTITYFAYGMNKVAGLFFQTVLSNIMNTLGGVSLGYLISSSIKSPTAAMQLSPMLAMPLMLVGGLFVNQSTMPIYIEVFSYVSPMQYSFNNNARLQYENSEYPAGKVFAEFLDIQRDYWDGVMYLAILIVSVLILGLIALRLLIEKFQ